MKIKITDNIYIGDESSCFHADKNEWVVIHACKSPCHQSAVGYRKSLPSNHENYLMKEKDKHLYLNMVDMNKLLHKFAQPIFIKAIDFMKENIEENNILIHCNIGYSRSPAIALVFMAKVSGEINQESYDEAKKDFQALYPNYRPGLGVDNYLRQYWDELSFA